MQGSIDFINKLKLPFFNGTDNLKHRALFKKARLNVIFLFNLILKRRPKKLRFRIHFRGVCSLYALSNIVIATDVQEFSSSLYNLRV